MRTALALCFLFSGGASVIAQEEFLLPTKMSLAAQRGPQPPRAGQSEWSTELFLRYSLIGGDTGDNGSLKTWDKVFSDGVGFRSEADYEYHINPTWSVGGYASLGLDVFGGKRVTAGGIRTSFDDWLVVPFTVGPKGRVYFGERWFAEAYLGFGFVSYGSVEASGLGVSVPFIDSSTAFAWEIGAHIAYKFNVDHGRAPTPQLGILFGLSYESWAAPDLNQTTFGGLSAKSVNNVTIDFGFWFGF